MSKKFQFNLKELLGIIIFTAFVTIILLLCIIIAYNYLETTPDIASSLIGAGGNLSGGVLGGIVAYIVAAYQLKNNSQQDEIKLSRKITSLLLLIKAELNHNKKLISKFKEDFSNSTNLELLDTITTEAWQNSADKLGERVTIDLIESLINCNAVINTYKVSSSSITVDLSNSVIKKLEDNIQKIDLELRNISP